MAKPNRTKVRVGLWLPPALAEQALADVIHLLRAEDWEEACPTP